MRPLYYERYLSGIGSNGGAYAVAKSPGEGSLPCDSRINLLAGAPRHDVLNRHPLPARSGCSAAHLALRPLQTTRRLAEWRRLLGGGEAAIGGGGSGAGGRYRGAATEQRRSRDRGHLGEQRKQTKHCELQHARAVPQVTCQRVQVCGGWRHADGAWHSGNRLPADPRIAAAVALKDAATRVNGHAFGCSSALGFSGATNPFASATSGSETARAFCCTSALGRTGATDPFASADADFGFRGPDSASGFPAAAEPSSSAPKLMQRHRSTTVSTACRPAAPPPLLPLHASRSSAPAAARASSPLADIPINTRGSGVGAFAKPRGPVPVDSHSEKCSWDGSCGVWRDSTGAEHEQYQVDRKRKAEQSLARHVKEGSVSLCYPRASCDVFGNMYLARKVAACRGT